MRSGSASSFVSPSELRTDENRGPPGQSRASWQHRPETSGQISYISSICSPESGPNTKFNLDTSHSTDCSPIVARDTTSRAPIRRAFSPRSAGTSPRPGPVPPLMTIFRKFPRHMQRCISGGGSCQLALVAPPPPGQPRRWKNEAITNKTISGPPDLHRGQRIHKCDGSFREEALSLLGNVKSIRGREQSIPGIRTEARPRGAWEKQCGSRRQQCQPGRRPLSDSGRMVSNGIRGKCS